MRVTFEKDTLPRVTFNDVNYNLNTAVGARSLAHAIIDESKSTLTKGELKRQKEILEYIENYFKKSHSTFEPQHKLLPIMMMLNALRQQDYTQMSNVANRIASLDDSDSNKYNQALFQGKRPFFSSGIFSIYKMCVETVSGHRPEGFLGPLAPSRLKKQKKLVKLIFRTT